MACWSLVIATMQSLWPECYVDDEELLTASYCPGCSVHDNIAHSNECSLWTCAEWALTVRSICGQAYDVFTGVAIFNLLVCGRCWCSEVLLQWLDPVSNPEPHVANALILLHLAPVQSEVYGEHASFIKTLTACSTGSVCFMTCKLLLLCHFNGLH